ncbi:Phosphoribosyl 1,2-cyclic phosphodiesterase [Verrucomicrobium sp. GAS474]|uniref:MBL fold metallo-hydrolase n=1 Tax=Verrucomicrobium sp. GAS474 TaxID=1882831 RepID=UPI00087C8CB5|nr:MBL fold metallo-hydrolase [Verrucomicrobium sp. GAS474]SDU08485.1 Phosphoribosyl 1,2-cyclic phosphodiesterase [Verrucomicrobium sp. GAS474]
MLRFTVLASGSSGNCAYLETASCRLLIDAGVSGRRIDQALAALGRSLKEVEAVFLTHEHSDHTSGLAVVAKKLGIPIWCNRATMEFLQPNLPGYDKWRLFETGETLSIGNLTIETFPISHDAYDPVGYIFHHDLGSVGFLTDLGHATRLVIERVRRARALVLEANYDLALLHADTKRPWAVKQRILSRHGHLSNEAAAELAAQIAGDKLEDLYLGHLSADCNHPDVAARVVGDRLREAGHGHIRLHPLAPDIAAATLCWD